MTSWLRLHWCGARRLREHCEALLDRPYEELWVGCWDEIGERLLREHAEAAGLDPFFDVLGRAERLAVLLDRFDKHVQWHVKVYWTRTSIRHQGERLPQREGQHLRTGSLEASLDIRPDYIHEIALEVLARLLERASIPLTCGHISRNVEHCGRVGEGARNGNNQIGGSGTA